MTRERSPDDRLAALATALVPASAGTLLSLLSSPEASLAQAHAQALSGRSRAERLAALASALAESTIERPTSLEAAAAAERPRIARQLLALAQPQAHASGDCSHPVLARLLAERGWPS